MMRWMLFSIICLTGSVLSAAIAAEPKATDSAAIAVVYPEVGKPYQDVIDSIIQGIRQQTGSALISFALKDGVSQDTLNSLLVQQHIKVVIALGKQGVEVTDKLPNGIQRVLGALLSIPTHDGISYAGGISLAPDPEIVFEKIRELSAVTHRVVVVYDPATNDWLIQLARSAAAKMELELVAVPAKDLREAAASYAQLQEKGLGKADLIWLLGKGRPDMATERSQYRRSEHDTAFPAEDFMGRPFCGHFQ
jgi:putative ABC transport system substrate-binding protein